MYNKTEVFCAYKPVVTRQSFRRAAVTVRYADGISDDRGDLFVIVKVVKNSVYVVFT